MNMLRIVQGKKYIAVSIYIEYKEALQTQPIGQEARKLIDGLEMFEYEKLWITVIHSLLEVFPVIRSVDKGIHKALLSPGSQKPAASRSSLTQELLHRSHGPGSLNAVSSNTCPTF